MRDLEFRFTVDALPDGTALTSAEAEQLLLSQVAEGPSKQTLWNLAMLYSQTGRQEEASGCIEKLVAMVETVDDRASCVLAMGQLREQVGDFPSAVRYYQRARELGESSSWYWIHNNLGYSLIQLGKHDEAEPYLQTAVRLDPRRPNAFKNLGLALAGRGERAAAAESFVQATQANASDGRSLNHLEELVAAYPELLVMVPDLPQKLAACRRAVHEAAAAQPDFRVHWEKLRLKRD